MSLQKESEEKPEDYAKKCPYRNEDCPIDYPKESEWEERLQLLYLERDTEPTIGTVKSFIRELLSQREKEIADEVEKMKTYTGGSSVNEKDKRVNKSEVLSIIKH